MKNLSLFVVLFFPSILAAQPDVSHNVEAALIRVEQAFRTRSPRSIEDLFVSGVTMRIGDSLYQSISSIRGLELLKSFFAGIDSVDFRFMMRGTNLVNNSGRMIYSLDGHRDTTNVDVWFANTHGEIMLNAINISNYPIATIFLDTSRQRHQQK